MTHAGKKKMSSERECEAEEEAVSDTLSVLMKVRIVQRVPTAVFVHRLFQGSELLVLAIFKTLILTFYQHEILTRSGGSICQTALGELDVPVMLQMLLRDDVTPEAAVNTLILLQSSLALVELDQDGGVGHIDQDVHGDGQDDEGQDQIDGRGVTKNALNVTSEPSE